MNWFCIQRGAREHYAIPRALHLAGRLEGLYTDFYAPSWLSGLSRVVRLGALRRLAGRRHQQLGGARIASWNMGAFRRSIAKQCENRYAYYLRENKWLSERCVASLIRNQAQPNGAVVFSYSGTALALFEWAKANGARTVLGVIDPGQVEQEMVREEAKLWPGWVLKADEPLEEYNRHRQREYRLADIVIVNSRWSLEALAQQGVPKEKMRVIPLCYEAPQEKRGAAMLFPLNSEKSSGNPFKVLYLGQVILRKGIQYLLEAARHPGLRGVVFDVVGPVGISRSAMNSAPPNVGFHGAVSRAEAEEWYQRSDLFVLPTISDGFAITQIEAMAYGLPVIATPNCGEVVRDGLDGMIVPVRGTEELADAILRFVRDNDFRLRCRQQAMRRCQDFTLNHLQRRLLEVEQEFVS